MDKTQREISKSYASERSCKLLSNCAKKKIQAIIAIKCQHLALGYVVLNKAALEITVVNCECMPFTRLSNKAEGWFNRKAPVDHIYTSMSSFTSTDGYTLHVNQE